MHFRLISAIQSLRVVELTRPSSIRIHHVAIIPIPLSKADAAPSSCRVKSPQRPTRPHPRNRSHVPWGILLPPRFWIFPTTPNRFRLYYAPLLFDYLLHMLRNPSNHFNLHRLRLNFRLRCAQNVKVPTILPAKLPDRPCDIALSESMRCARIIDFVSRISPSVTFHF